MQSSHQAGSEIRGTNTSAPGNIDGVPEGALVGSILLLFFLITAGPVVSGCDQGEAAQAQPLLPAALQSKVGRAERTLSI